VISRRFGLRAVSVFAPFRSSRRFGLRAVSVFAPFGSRAVCQLRSFDHLSVNSIVRVRQVGQAGWE
jgi:hypothetical protein